MKKYKYLNYIPRPVKLKPEIYDLVDDDEFCTPDWRIPLLMLTQYGVFPAKGYYKGKNGYFYLEGLDNQRVAFIRRGYLSNREYGDIIEIFLDAYILREIRSNRGKIGEFL